MMDSKPNTTRVKILLATFLVIAILFRLASWSGRLAMQTDSEVYISTGLNWVQGNGLVDTSGNTLVSKPPLYSILIGIVSLAVGDGERAARTISFLAGLGLLSVLFYLSKSLYGSRVAAVLVGLASIYPALVNTSTAALAESATVLFLMSGLFSMRKLLVDWNLRSGFLCGLFFSLAVWTRTSAVLVAVSAVLMILLFLFPRRAEEKQKRRNAATLLLLTLVLTLQPMMYRNYSNTGRWTLNPEASVWMHVMMDAKGESGFDGQEMERAVGEAGSRIKEERSFLSRVADQPGDFARHYVENAYTFYKQTIPTEIPPLILFFAGLGFTLTPIGGYRALSSLIPLFLPIVVWMAMRGGEPRDVIPLVPGVLVLSSAGMYSLWRWGVLNDIRHGGMIWGRLLSVVLIALTCLFCIPGSLRFVLDTQGQPVEHKVMGQWIAENIDPDERSIMTRKPMVAFYAHGRSLPVAPGTIEDLRDHATSIGARLFAMDSRDTAVVYPEYRALLNSPDDIPDWLKPIHRVETADGEKMVLFRVSPGADR